MGQRYQRCETGYQRVQDKHHDVSPSGICADVRDIQTMFPISWEGTIADLTAEIKKLTLKAVLMGVGALLCFAAAAFIPGGSGYFVAQYYSEIDWFYASQYSYLVP